MKKVLFIIIVIVNMAACESESRLSSIDMLPSVDAYVGNYIVLEVSHTPANAMVPAFRFKTNNQFVASVNAQGAVVCNHVGTCTIQVATADTRFSTTCIVNVKPNQALFAEPVLDFKTTKAAIKLKEAGRTIVYETATMLIYQGFESPVQQVAYQFDGNHKLVTSVVELTAASAELESFMAECYDRYQTAGNNDLLVWRGNDMEVVAKIFNETSCYVVYHPFSGSSTCASALRSIETVRAAK